MKILQVNCVYKNGSTGKIVYDIHKGLLEKGYDSIVCYGRGKKVNENNVYKVSNELYSKFNNLLSRFTGYMYGGCLFSTRKLISIIKKEKPDIVHLHCINGYFINIYKLISWLKNNNIKTVLTLHAEFMYTANCGHALECEKWKSGCGKCPRLKQETKSMFLDRTHESWEKMYNAFKNFNNLTIVSVSPWLMKRAKESPMLKDKNHITILNGINTNIFRYHNTNQLRKELGFNNKKIILHVTPYFSSDKEHLKGGYYVLELTKMLKDENVQILVAGKHKPNIKVPRNVTLLGEVQEQELLAKYYSMADITLLTSQKETFSMVTVESLCCGTPVIGFKAGAPEQIAIKEYSSFVEYGDTTALYRIIKENLNTTKGKNISNAAIKEYCEDKMIEKYLKIYYGKYNENKDRKD